MSTNRRQTLQVNLSVVAVSPGHDPVACVQAHERAIEGTPQLPNDPPSGWTQGAAVEWRVGSRDGLIIDLDKLDPNVRHLVVYTRPTWVTR